MKQFSKFFSIVAIIGLALALSGCGPRQKKLLNKLSVGMIKREVESKMGKPDEIHCPVTTRRGDVIDIWEYNLATVDREKENRRIAFQLCGWFLFWPLLCFPYAWESSYEYDTYFLKFVNNLLLQWGKRMDVALPA